MLYGEVIFYDGDYAKQVNSLCGNNAEFLMSKLAVHVKTLGFKELSFFCMFF